jgi:hypothetical protein
MAIPDFSPETINLLAFRACLICNNPDCETVTVGPSDATGDLAIKLGEAAHIRAKRTGQARFDEGMSDEERAAAENGIWLCASCHTMVDKNRGLDFPTETLIDWKRKHEEVIRSLLYSQCSPWTLLRKFTEEGHIAQKVVDALENHGALYMDRNVEHPPDVILSVERLRSELGGFASKVRYDSNLKNLIKDMATECRLFMNYSSSTKGYEWHELETMRSRLGFLIRRLKEDYGCMIRGQLHQILPRS